MILEKILSSVKKNAARGLGIATLGALAFLSPSKSFGDTHYVSKTGLHQEPYTNLVSAATNIQSAVDAAHNGDNVIISDGIYNVAPTNGITWNASSKHLNIASENGAENCIIDCQQKGRAFTLDAGQNSSDVIDGITIKNGKSLWKYTGENLLWGGGGMFIRSTSPSIKNCTIRDCVAYKSPQSSGFADGGAIDIVGPNASPTISHCNFIKNTARHTGGGVHVLQATPLIEYNLFESNHNGGCYGGGALSFTYNASGTVKNNIITKNTAHYYTSKGGFGAGIECMNSNPTIMDNTIVNNCTYLNGNPSSPGEGGGVRIRGLPTAVMKNNILFGNLSGAGLENLDCQYPDYTLNISYSLIGSGSTNFICPNRSSNLWFANPSFVDTNDFHLQENSPCVDSGVNESWMNSAQDIEGNARKIDGNYDGNARVDIGCYEFVPPEVSVISSFAGNGAVNPEGTNYVTKGTGTNFNVLANEGSHISEIRTNGVPAFAGSKGNSYTNFSWNRIMNPTNTFEVSFDADLEEIVASSGEHGRVNPNGTVYLTWGNSTNFQAEADEFYHISEARTNDVLVPEASGMKNYAFNFNNVKTNQTLDVNFAPNMTSNNVPEQWLYDRGITNNFNEEELKDHDEDGMKTWQEYKAGTDPLDWNSALYVTDISSGESGNTVNWTAGTKAHYLERSTNLLSGAWDRIYTNASPTSATNSFTDADSPRVSFYRIKAEI